jgi:uridine kinase
MKYDRINNEERRFWILNDEALYRWHKYSRKSMRQFIRENKQEIDEVITQTLKIEPRGNTR